jgi:hypothetical protein
MGVTDCNIGNAPIEVAGNSLQCSAGVFDPFDDILKVTGSSSLNRIRISRAQLEVHLDGASVNAPSPFPIEGSSVCLVLVGSPSSFTSTVDTPAVECSGESNVSVVGNGITLSVTTGTGAAAIGAGPSGSCESLTISGTTVSGFGGTVIGASPAFDGNYSYLRELNITGGTISRTHPSSNGAVIGTGACLESGVSRIDTAIIEEMKSEELRSNEGAVIGTGTGSLSGNSSIGTLWISGSVIKATCEWHGSGVGTGIADLNGSSRIDNL